MKVTTYKKEHPTSYALGASLVFELLRAAPHRCRRVLVSDAYVDRDGKLAALCAAHGVPVQPNSRAVNMLSPKDNCFVVGEFDKQSAPVAPDVDHIVLVDPSDRGNVGTVIRTAAAFGWGQVVVIGGVDVNHPKVVRASMGAFFHCPVAVCADFESYRAAAGTRAYFPFMLTGATPLHDLKRPQGNVSLLFGNEASGLPECFAAVGTPVKIRQSRLVDSLSLPMAVAVGAYHLTAVD